jgi:hypothetical protein
LHFPGVDTGTFSEIDEDSRSFAIPLKDSQKYEKNWMKKRSKNS